MVVSAAHGTNPSRPRGGSIIGRMLLAYRLSYDSNRGVLLYNILPSTLDIQMDRTSSSPGAPLSSMASSKILQSGRSEFLSGPLW